jgi:hypothetical protein
MGGLVTEDEKTAIARGVQAVIQEVRRRMALEDGLDRVGPYCPPELRYARQGVE